MIHVFVSNHGHEMKIMVYNRKKLQELNKGCMDVNKNEFIGKKTDER